MYALGRRSWPTRCTISEVTSRAPALRQEQRKSPHLDHSMEWPLTSEKFWSRPVTTGVLAGSVCGARGRWKLWRRKPTRWKSGRVVVDSATRTYYGYVPGR